ncbi:substrate-binding domain-containing protein [Frigidibacter sp. ROC022]|uniref:substrate-binding domain-containing protein n=1 Tax=Frigidibacter sp. ROC022 TaxID=2971796 RepID=UPI00215B29E7|nr:substrate-binding domain-containing protein [Frigidibacter sp. ROC022]MCR8725399.1 substrate-binding domain-containing protein [Frigidibacter sp. ROC022]
MGRHRQNGVDGAIALLSALAECGEDAIGTKEARNITGVPRTSLHRIGKVLAESGLVSLSRGRIATGDKASVLRKAYAKQVYTDFQRRSTRDVSVRTGFPKVIPGYFPASPVLSLGRARPTNRRRFHIGFSNTSLGNDWRMALVHSIEYGAGGLGDALDRLAIRHADDNAELQSLQIRSLVEDGADGLLVSAENSPLIAAELENAVRRGVRVVLVDRAIGGFRAFDSFVNSSDQLIGHVTALWLAETLQGRGRVLLLPGKRGAAPAIARLAAAKEVFRRFPDICITACHWTDWRPEIARSRVESHLRTRERPFDGVWSDSGLQGVGSLQAYLAAGYSGRDIPPHTGGDLNQVYKLALQNDVRMVAVDYPPSMGLVGIETLFSALRGSPVPRTISVRSDVIVTRGDSTRSVSSTMLFEDHVRWDLPDQLILQSGISRAYDPHSFRVRYPGNSYNRSAAQLARQSGAGTHG